MSNPEISTASWTDTRVYLADKEVYGNKIRPLFGIPNSAIVMGDDGNKYGLVGPDYESNVVDPTTKLTPSGQTVPVPLDFRKVGIEIMGQFGVPHETQVAMFDKFMTDYSKEERDAFVESFEALDPEDTEAVQAFVDQMVAMLT